MANSLQKKLDDRLAQNALRELSVNNGLIDFSSNDYLGIAMSTKLRELTEKKASEYNLSGGSTGSRLLSGNSFLVEKLESVISTFHQSESGLIFNSGYLANLGFFSTVPQRGDTIIYDEYIHASIRDGIRLSNASNFSFKHNELDKLKEKLGKAKGTIYVVVESVYSMDGDQAPLSELVTICNKYKALLVVDEAHAVGVVSKEGLVCKLGLENQVYARVVTFGKSLGVHGAIILGNDQLRQYLINFCRPFIYTTALSYESLVAVESAYECLEKADDKIQALHKLIDYFKQKAIQKSLTFIPSDSAVQGIIISGNSEVKEISCFLKENKFDVRPIMSPTVPQGKERLRICLHIYNSEEEIDQLIELINGKG